MVMIFQRGAPELGANINHSIHPIPSPSVAMRTATEKGTLMNRKTFSLLLTLALLTVNLLPPVPAPFISRASVALVRPDLYIKDTPVDAGVEPNPDMRSDVGHGRYLGSHDT